MSEGLQTLLVSWDKIIDVIRRASPKPGEYGLGDRGGHTPKILKMLADADLVERVASGVRDADFAYDRKTKVAWEIILKAEEARQDAISAIVKSLS